MSKLDDAVAWAVGIANDNSHGYDQGSRYGPDYDCSSLLIEAWERAGVPVKSHGASYTGNMRTVFLRCGFEDVTSLVNQYSGTGLQKGDVLLNIQSHTAMMVSPTQLVQASKNERGGVTGGQRGDQTGTEIAVRSYYRYNGGWDCILRYKGDDKNGSVSNSGGSSGIGGGYGSARQWRQFPALKKGDRGEAVKAWQYMLLAMGGKLSMYGADGDFGAETETETKSLQKYLGTTPDGVVGYDTMSRVMKR